MTSAQVEANNVARFDHEMAIEKYWNDCYAYLATWMVTTYLPTASFSVTLQEVWDTLETNGGVQSVVALIDTMESRFQALSNLANSNIKNHEVLLQARGGVKLDADKNHTLVIQNLTEEQKILKLARMIQRFFPNVAEQILEKGFTYPTLRTLL